MSSGNSLKRRKICEWGSPIRCNIYTENGGLRVSIKNKFFQKHILAWLSKPPDQIVSEKWCWSFFQHCSAYWSVSCVILWLTFSKNNDVCIYFCCWWKYDIGEGKFMKWLTEFDEKTNLYWMLASFLFAFGSRDKDRKMSMFY